MLKERFHIITYPEHLSYYTKSTLNKLLKDLGFRKKKLLTTGVSISHYRISTVKEGDGTSPAKPIGKQADEKLRKRFAKSPVLGVVKKMVNNGLTVLGLGMTLKAYYVKQ
jgi:hypothetical protein